MAYVPSPDQTNQPAEVPAISRWNEFGGSSGVCQDATGSVIRSDTFSVAVPIIDLSVYQLPLQYAVVPAN